MNKKRLNATELEVNHMLLIGTLIEKKWREKHAKEVEAVKGINKYLKETCKGETI